MKTNQLDDFDGGVLADKTIEKLDVRAGQVIWIWANVHSLDLVEELAFRIRTRGAFWLLRLTSEPLLRRIGLEVSEPFLSMIPEHEMRWLDDMDAIIEIRDHPATIPDVPLERRRAMGAEWLALIATAACKGIRRLMVFNPTASLAAAYNLSLDELRRRFWQAVSIDCGQLDRQQEKIKNILQGVQEVHIKSPAGTDLYLRVADRPVQVDGDSIPYGEVYVAPHEESANGMAVIDKAFFRAKMVENFQLTFVDGRVVEAKAPNQGDTLSWLEVMAASNGDKDVIAELGIGLNPGISEPIGNVSLDEKIGGSVHIAVGMNDHFGGINKSNLHQDFVILNPTVWFDGKVVIENGAFKI
jgi:aminopeptidase